MGGGAAGAAGCSESVRRSWVNPPAAGACAGAGGGGAKIGSGALSATLLGSWFNACSSCVKPPCAGGEELAAGAGNGKLLAGGSGASGFSGSKGGGAAGALGVENICVNAPGLALRAGSSGGGGGAGAGVPGALSPRNP